MPAAMLHPAYRATHAVLGAQRIALALARNTDLAPELRDEATKITLLLSEVAPDVAALRELIEAQQRDLRGMCQDGLEMAREVTALRKQVEGIHQGDASHSAPLQIPLTREPRPA